MRQNKLKKLTYSALLTAFSIIIPIVFGSFLKIQIPPFSATITSHVPMFLAMFVGPEAAVVVGIGSFFGFLLTSSAVVAFRALTHAFVGLAGAIAIKKGIDFKKVIFITMPIHAGLEALVVIPFGFTMYSSLVIVGIGTALHHIADGFIAAVLVKAIEKALRIRFTEVFAK